MLHAHRLTFTNPLTLETIQVEAPSKSFEEGLKNKKRTEIVFLETFLK